MKLTPISLVLMLCLGAQAGNLAKEVEAILQPKKHGDLEYGVIVQSLDRGDVLYEANPDIQLIPASVNKVVTAYTALKKLRPTATFKTSVHVTGAIRDGMLLGDLFLKGGGDPSLVSERMWMLVNDLHRSGIRSISGNIVGDSSFYDLERTPETRPKYLKDQAYNAPVGALSFNFNTTTVYLRPGEKPGEPPVIFIDPQNPYIDVVNQAKTGKAGTSNSIVAMRLDYVKGVLGDTVLLRGSIPLDGKELRFYRNIVNPALYTGHMFKTFLESRGIKVTGEIVEGTVPVNARRLLEFESLPVWQVVWGMNKFSNNFVADQLMKKIGAEVWGPPGTLQKGISAVEEALEDIGVKKGVYRLVDGSGLTRETHISARQLLTVLRAAYKDFSISAEFISSLAIAGEDGSLKRRFSSTTQTDNAFLRAKTGTLDGVSSLAGYTTSADGEKLAFVILLNDKRMKYGSMIDWRDKIAEAVHRYQREKKNG
ncbi:MAG: D-alanyl-D-alanine carboxypeptidase/D-alanyl-D-alanine-endopeptidase [Deltaproteobacteria bacterium]|nr:D-alanyl-D-alanine carboxypeptidase/D-alanyl-D-alanine-endopeptidase [Deltaproteobacteria bacterium]MBI3293401.1 D-alanyl-D-alanine carboxypeptidase/D-alanyl-D-alanine-endopeptidase [Deltaproteobacteria bacterium]